MSSVSITQAGIDIKQAQTAVSSAALTQLANRVSTLETNQVAIVQSISKLEQVYGVTYTNILLAVAASDNHSILKTAVESFPDLKRRLENPKDCVSLVAPTNDAFVNMAVFSGMSLEDFTDPLKNPDLEKVIMYHAFANRCIPSTGRQTSITGEDMSVLNKDGVIAINGTPVTATLHCGNGKVHVVENVLSPSSLPKVNLTPDRQTALTADFRTSTYTDDVFEMQEVHTFDSIVWNVEELNANLLLVTEQYKQTIHVVNKATGAVTTSLDLKPTFPNLYSGRQGGIHAVKKHVDANGNVTLFFSTTTHAKATSHIAGAPGTKTGSVEYPLAVDEEGAAARIGKVSVTIDSNDNVSFGTPSLIYKSTPFIAKAEFPFEHTLSTGTEGLHYGGAIEIVGDRLFVTFGDMFRYLFDAQNKDNTHGTTCCLNLDGTPVNMGVSTVRPEVMSYGHRNSQGLCYLEHQNVLLATEHGARGGDEINVIKVNNNHGWPYISTGGLYAGTDASLEPRVMEYVNAADYLEKNADNPDAIKPVDGIFRFIPSVAPRDIKYIKHDKYGMQGSLLVAGLKFHGESFMKLDLTKGTQSIERLSFDVSPEPAYPEEGYGRTSGILECQDGTIYVVTHGYRKRFVNNIDDSSEPYVNTGKLYKLVRK